MHQQSTSLTSSLRTKMRKSRGWRGRTKNERNGRMGSVINYFSPPVAITPSSLTAIALTMVFCWELEKRNVDMILHSN